MPARKKTKQAVKKKAKRMQRAPAPAASARKIDDDWIRKVHAVIREVPRGCVASYGQVAALAGRPRSARHVGRILRGAGDAAGLPWHRIVNGQGALSLEPGHAGLEQRRRLKAEGVEFKANGRIDLRRFGWRL